MERSLAPDQDRRHIVPSSSRTKRCHAELRGISLPENTGPKRYREGPKLRGESSSHEATLRVKALPKINPGRITVLSRFDARRRPALFEFEETKKNEERRVEGGGEEGGGEEERRVEGGGWKRGGEHWERRGGKEKGEKGGRKEGRWKVETKKNEERRVEGGGEEERREEERKRGGWRVEERRRALGEERRKGKRSQSQDQLSGLIEEACSAHQENLTSASCS
ncbi:hypothetical protein JOQ06_007952 [Pogonophryne albipinna]|uniref:Uncharacterized protein n=1 Tax=Pogonophryne albipinna TaxID=1090488 RepID=A0AAD6AJ84_9TELE|nr:hypothetical protein JOQ06_007952 [Pogonophryne albipinna]